MRDRPMSGGLLAAGALAAAMWAMLRFGRTTSVTEPRRKATTRRQRRGITQVQALPGDARWNVLLGSARDIFRSRDHHAVAAGSGIAAAMWLAWSVPGLALATAIGALAQVPSPSWAEVALGASSLFLAFSGFGWFGLRALISWWGGPSRIDIVDDAAVLALAVATAWLARPPL